MDRAKRELTQALAKDPEFVPAMFDLGLIFEQEKQYPRALALYRKVLEHQPNSSRAWASIGRLYLLTGKQSLALKAFQRAKGLEKDSPAASLQVGLIYLELKYYDDAIRELRPLTTLPQYKNQARYFAGTAYEEKGNVREAQQMYQGISGPPNFTFPAVCAWPTCCSRARKGTRPIRSWKKSRPWPRNGKKFISPCHISSRRRACGTGLLKPCRRG